MNQNLSIKKLLSMFVAMCLLTLSFTACGQKDEGPQTIDIATSLVTVQFPAQYKDNLHHTEITEGGSTIEIFSMVYENTCAELFRVIFSDEGAESPVGYLHTDNGVKTITVDTSADAGMNIEDDVVRTLYMNMKDGVGVVIDSIISSTEFSQYKNISIGDTTVTSTMSYWDVDLPDEIECVETSSEQLYKADFYGIIEGYKVPLYTIQIGGEMDETPFGTMQSGDKLQPVYIVVHNIEENADLSEDDKTAAYLLMDTINTVITAMKNNENFSAQ